MMRPIDLDKMLDQLERVRRTHNGATARCPAHEDRTPSLSISVVDGHVLWKCHAGCTQEEVTAALRERGAIPQPEASRPLPWMSYKVAKRLRGRERKQPSKPTRESDSLPNAIWQAGTPMVGGPGVKYHNYRGVYTRPPHQEVRWVNRNTALTLAWRPSTGVVRLLRHGCRPQLPGGGEIAGIIVYRFSSEDDPPNAAGACQIEAIRADGSRALFLEDHKVKRPSVANSDFAHGARVFRARPGDPGAGLYICEGPLDALALSTLGERRDIELRGAAVIGVPGTGNVTIRNLGTVKGPVRVAVDNDKAGDTAIQRMIEELEACGMAGRRHNHRPPHPFNDWSDYLRDMIIRTTPPPEQKDWELPGPTWSHYHDPKEK